MTLQLSRSLLRQVSRPQGHTVIQVTPEGENCILLFGGSNLCVTREQVTAARKAGEAEIIGHMHGHLYSVTA